MPGGNRGAWSSITCLICLAVVERIGIGLQEDSDQRGGNVVVRRR